MSWFWPCRRRPAALGDRHAAVGPCHADLCRGRGDAATATPAGSTRCGRFGGRCSPSRCGRRNRHCSWHQPPIVAPPPPIRDSGQARPRRRGEVLRSHPLLARAAVDVRTFTMGGIEASRLRPGALLRPSAHRCSHSRRRGGSRPTDRRGAGDMPPAQRPTAPPRNLASDGERHLAHIAHLLSDGGAPHRGRH